MDMFATRPAPSPAVTALHRAVAQLSGRDREIAQSLLDGAARRAWSDKQATLAASLATRAGAPAVQTTDGLTSIVAMLTAAGAKLKYPVIRFGAGEIGFRLGLSGAGSRTPGSVGVTSDAKAYVDRTYYGRITPDGVFEPHRNHPALHAVIGQALVSFAAAPAEQARIYGQRFGRCCFCGIELINRHSVDAGYGPICADKFGLTWGA